MKILSAEFKPKVFNSMILTIVNVITPISILLLSILVKNDFDTNKSFCDIFSHLNIYIAVLIVATSYIYNNSYSNFIKWFQQANEDIAQIDIIKKGAFEQLRKSLIENIKKGDMKGFDQTTEFINKTRKDLGK